MSDSPKQPRRRGTGRGAGLLNCLTIIILLLAVLSGAVVAVLFQYPGVLAFIPGGSAYMPQRFPVTAVVLLTPTPVPVSTDESGQPIYPTFPPTWTPENTPTVTHTPRPPTATPSPTTTPSATPTLTPTVPGGSPTATHSAFNFTLQPGNPTYLKNFLNNQGCNWFGIVGQAFGIDGNPRRNFKVRLEGGGLDVEALTGSGSPALGPGGYQIPIADHPIATSDTYRVQLRNNNGTPLSEVYTIETYGDCDRAMIMVNFVQNH